MLPKKIIQKLKPVVRKYIKYFVSGFYLLLVADVLLVESASEFTYLLLSIYFVLLFILLKKVETRFIYLLCLVLIISSALLSAVDLISQADKAADYTFIFLLIGLIVDTIEYSRKEN